MGVSLAKRFSSPMSKCSYHIWRGDLVFLKRELKSLTQARRKVMRRSPEVACGEGKWRKWRRGSQPTWAAGELCGKIWGVSSFSFKGEIHPTFPLLCYTIALVPKSFRHFGKCCPKCPLLLIKISGYQRFLVGMAERALTKLHSPCLWHEQSLLCECGVVFIPGPSIILWVTENTIYFHLCRP